MQFANSWMHSYSKFQIPSTKFQTKNKIKKKKINILYFKIWGFEFVWNLVLGIWDLYDICLECGIIFYLCRRVSLMRPAPIELPQVRKEARVSGWAVRHKGLTLFYCHGSFVMGYWSFHFSFFIFRFPLFVNLLWCY